MSTSIVLSGIPGSMCREILAASADDAWTGRVELERAGLASPHAQLEGTPFEDWNVCKPATVPEGRIVVDFTTPGAALENVRAYVANGISFVMGTTGFDVGAATQLVKSSSSCAVIAPNMAVPIVLALAAARHLAKRFPNALAGVDATLRESHQSTKRDSSGTAKALETSLAELGARPARIESIRDPEAQRALGIPAGHLAGHGWHWLELSGGGATLRFATQVNGRRAYADGALLAAEFLSARRARGARGEVYSMEAVLAAGG